MPQYTAADFTVQNATAADTAQLNRALEYLQQSPDAQEILKGMHDKGVKINIIHDGNDRYNGTQNTIYWDPKSALTVKPNAGAQSTGTQSPALGLIHEGAHATDPQFIKHLGEYNAKYDNNAEKYAIEKESKIADKLGEPKRENHHSLALPNVADATTHTNNIYDKDGKLVKAETHTYAGKQHGGDAPAKESKRSAVGDQFDSLMNSFKEYKETGDPASMGAAMKSIGDANVTGLIPTAAASVDSKEKLAELETARQAPQVESQAVEQPKGRSR